MPQHRRYGKRVLIHYRGSLSDGRVFDDNTQGEALEVMIGARCLPPGIEEALHEMAPGEERSLALSPDKAFGQIDAAGIMELPRYAVPRAHELRTGMRIEWHSPHAAQPVNVLVAAINEATVTLDFNHPLAGESVVYWVRLVAVLD
ncbi:MAG: FKBP-type peptidyl-prolyl cis-trans isomerase [Coriobacteriales bacterium]|jgi:peptidylprolyl isomerase|nr:FKBP-type peptidyl-prolyl cis-trans isomerase [Coriobacteriales bacterium]